MDDIKFNKTYNPNYKIEVKSSAADEIKKLYELKNIGAISNEEFETKKTELLN